MGVCARGCMGVWGMLSHGHRGSRGKATCSLGQQCDPGLLCRFGIVQKTPTRVAFARLRSTRAAPQALPELTNPLAPQGNQVVTAPRGRQVGAGDDHRVRAHRVQLVHDLPGHRCISHTVATRARAPSCPGSRAPPALVPRMHLNRAWLDRAETRAREHGEPARVGRVAPCHVGAASPMPSA